jgi:hypothetical protein
LNQVFKYIRDFYSKEFNAFYLLVIMLLLGVLIYLNYWHGLEKRYVAGGKTKLANFAAIIYYIFCHLPPHSCCNCYFSKTVLILKMAGSGLSLF